MLMSVRGRTELTVAGRGSEPRRLRPHRRFDRHGYKVFVIADEAHERRYVRHRTDGAPPEVVR